MHGFARRHLLLSLVGLLLPLSVASLRVHASALHCVPEQAEPLELSAFLELVESRGLRLRAARQGESAAHQAWQAQKQSARPMLSTRLQADAGQRARPSNERDLGRSARGDLSSSLSWPLYRAQRDSLEQLMRSRREQAHEQAELVLWELRLEAGAAYVEANAARRNLEHARHLQQRTEELAALVFARAQEAVETPYQTLLAKERQLAVATALEIAQERYARALVEMSWLAGRCAAPRASELDWQPPAVAEHPAVSLARAAARQHRAQARVSERANTLDLDAFGSAGLHVSPAFEGLLQPEYISGIAFAWRPDLFGVQRRFAEAEQGLAKQAELEAQAIADELRLELLHLERQGLRYAEMYDRASSQAALTKERVRVATLRWNEGVEPLQEVLAAHQAQARASEVLLELESALLLMRLRHAALGGVEHSSASLLRSSTATP